MTESETILIGETASVVGAFVSKNHVSTAELPVLIASVHGAFAGLVAGSSPAPAEAPSELATPAQIRKSITPAALISFIDGKPYKTLKRHLTVHGLEPASYRKRFGLPGDYPMVCASYSATRSELARDLGLGQRREAAQAAE